MFADLAGEANPRFDPELGPRFAESVRQCVPLGPGEHDAEVRNRHSVAVDGVGERDLFGEFRAQMGRNLVAEELEIDPRGRLAADLAAQAIDVERSGFLDVSHGKREVEGLHGKS